MITTEEYETAIKNKKEIINEIFHLKIQYELSKDNIEYQNEIKKIIKEKQMLYKKYQIVIAEYERGENYDKYKRR